MASIEPESPPPPLGEADRKLAVPELIRGHESAIRLGILLQETLPPGNYGPESATRVLVEEVLGSFSRALFALDSGEKPEVRQELAMTNAGSPYSEDRRSEVSSGKRKIPPVRRGAYRRRAHPYSLTRTTAKTLDDGYTWRKYGQKDIYSAKFPRSYFRCTHKHDQGCQATRQVQRSEDDPSLFVITYMGEHTCRDPTTVIASRHETPYLISFGSNTAVDRREPLLPSSLPPLKQEADEEVLSNLTHGSSSSEYLVLPDLKPFEGSAPLEQAVGAASDHGDVTSGLHSSAGSLELDFANSFEFDDVFNFDDHGDFFRD